MLYVYKSASFILLVILCIIACSDAAVCTIYNMNVCVVWTCIGYTDSSQMRGFVYLLQQQRRKCCQACKTLAVAWYYTFAWHLRAWMWKQTPCSWLLYKANKNYFRESICSSCFWTCYQNWIFILLCQYKCCYCACIIDPKYLIRPSCY